MSRVAVGDPLARIRRAARQVWPGAAVAVARQGPRPTRVWHVTVAGQEVWAKTDDPGGPPRAQREAAGLRWLADQGVRVPEVAGIAHGVLFTRRVGGPTLGYRLAVQPERTVQRVTGALAAVDFLARPETVLPPAVRNVPVPLGIAGEFLRTFCTRARLPAIRPRLGTRLWDAARPLLPHAASSTGDELVPAYGALLPEHVRWPLGGGPVLISPLLRRAPAGDDAAQLVSRTILMAATRMSADNPARELILTGIDTVVRDLAGGIPGAPGRREWLRGFMARWLMDTATHTAACLAIPSDRLSPQARAVVANAPALIDFLARATAALPDHRPSTTWATSLDLIRALRH